MEGGWRGGGGREEEGGVPTFLASILKTSSLVSRLSKPSIMGPLIGGSRGAEGRGDGDREVRGRWSGVWVEEEGRVVVVVLLPRASSATLFSSISSNKF